MSEKWPVRKFATPQPCDFCGTPYSALSHFATVQIIGTTEYKSYFICAQCFGFRYIPTTEGDPAYGVD